MLCAITSSGAPKQPPNYIVTTVADPTRPAEDKAQDINRHPKAVLTFSDLTPGAKVVETIRGKTDRFVYKFRRHDTRDFAMSRCARFGGGRPVHGTAKW
jgi:predicted methyltransferase